MKVNIKTKNQQLVADLSAPIDISRPLVPGGNCANAYFASPPVFEPVISRDFIGKVTAGSPVNFMNVHLNPHGNGTHTECIGHILPFAENFVNEPNTINKRLQNFHLLCQVISVQPEKQPNGDEVISLASLENQLSAIEEDTRAIAIRTLPNGEDKIGRNYSGANPPYFHQSVLRWMAEHNITHFLTDLPSVDREEDGGKLLAHRAFWGLPEKPRTQATITEMIYIPQEVEDGLYLLNLQIAPFELDAAPSKPVLFRLVG